MKLQYIGNIYMYVFQLGTQFRLHTFVIRGQPLSLENDEEVGA